MKHVSDGYNQDSTSVSYVSLWPLHDGLTQGSVLPIVSVLSQDPRIARVTLFTLEAEFPSSDWTESTDFTWRFKVAARRKGLGLSRVWAVLQLTWALRRGNADLILARGMQASGVAWLATRFSKTPFIVESVEPHSKYMTENRTWRSWGIKALLQRFLERRSLSTAAGLIVLSPHYRDLLVAQDSALNERIVGVLPCVADGDLFRKSEAARSILRAQLGIGLQEKVGIYVGKFGDIYFQPQEALTLVSSLLNDGVLERMIILTRQQPEIRGVITQMGVDPECIIMDTVPHNRVPDFLAAADLGFSFVKPSAARRYCSPIKTAEYWAAGLPIVTAPGISSDSEVVKDTGLGVVCAVPHIDEDSISHLKKLLSAPDTRTRVRKQCFPHRDIQQCRPIYADAFTRALKRAPLG